MATYYWVGGSGTWDTTSTTNWSLTSGGAGGAGVPTSADDVIFNSLSGATTDTVSVQGGKCRNLSGTSTTTVIDLEISTLDIYGNLTLTTQMGFNPSLGYPVIFFYAPSTGVNTITSAGKDLGYVYFNDDLYASGGGWTLSGTFTATGGISVFGGVFNTANVTINCQDIEFKGFDSACTVNLGSSTINISRAVSIYGGDPSAAFFEVIELAFSVTMNAGTSIINMANSTAPYDAIFVYFAGGDKTYNRLNLNSYDVYVTGNNTFAIFTYTCSSTSHAEHIISTISLTGNQTVTGTYSVSGNSIINRLWVFSDEIGTPRTIAVPATRTSNYVNYRDITVTGTALAGTSLGNMLGCTNITFTTPVTRYARNTNGMFMEAASWSATSGGAASTVIPLPQDTIIFDANSSFINCDNLCLGADLNISAAYPVSHAFINSTFRPTGVGICMFGNLTNHKRVFLNSNASLVLASRTTRNISFVNDVCNDHIAIMAPGATVTFDNVVSFDIESTTGFGLGLNIMAGTVDLNGNTLFTGNIISANVLSEPNVSIASVSKTFVISSSSIYLRNPSGRFSLVSPQPSGYSPTVYLGSSINQTGGDLNITSNATTNFYLDTPEYGTSTTRTINFGNTLASNQSVGNVTFNFGQSVGWTTTYLSALTIPVSMTVGTFSNTSNRVIQTSLANPYSVSITFTVNSITNSATSANIFVGANPVAPSYLRSIIAPTADINTTNSFFKNIEVTGANTLTARGIGNLGGNQGITYNGSAVALAYTTVGNYATTPPSNFIPGGLSVAIVIAGGQGGSCGSTFTRGGAGGRAGYVSYGINLISSSSTPFYINVGTGGAGAVSGTSVTGGIGGDTWINVSGSNATPTTFSAGVSAFGGGSVFSTGPVAPLFFVGGNGGTVTITGGASGGGGGSTYPILGLAQLTSTSLGLSGGSGTASGGRKGGGGGGVTVSGSTGLSGGNGGAGYNAAAGGAGGADNTNGGNGTNGSGGGGGGGSFSSGIAAGNGGNGSTALDVNYVLLNGVPLNGFGSDGSGGGGGGGVSLALTRAGDGGNGSIGGGGGGGGGSITATAGYQGNGGSGGAGTIIMLYEVRLPNTYGFILGEE